MESGDGIERLAPLRGATAEGCARSRDVPDPRGGATPGVDACPRAAVADRAARDRGAAGEVRVMMRCAGTRVPRALASGTCTSVRRRAAHARRAADVVSMPFHCAFHRATRRVRCSHGGTGCREVHRGKSTAEREPDPTGRRHPAAAAAERTASTSGLRCVRVSISCARSCTTSAICCCVGAASLRSSRARSRYCCRWGSCSRRPGSRPHGAARQVRTRARVPERGRQRTDAHDSAARRR